MTELPAPDAPKVLLTLEHVAQWKADLLRNTARIAELGEENALIERRLAAASVFLDIESVPPASPVKGASEVIEKDLGLFVDEAMPVKARRKRKHKGPIWADVVLDAVNSAPMGLTYAEMRQVAHNSALGPKLAQSDKGYHNAIGRLARNGEIVREHGRLFTREAYERFMAAVDAGEATTTVPQPFAYSPMGEAILDIVAKCPATLNGKGVINELRKDAEFNAALTPHETGAHNIIARLVRREQIVRRDDGTLIPGRNFPKDRGIAPQRNEAPSGITAGASEAGEAATSPNDTQSISRMIG